MKRQPPGPGAAARILGLAGGIAMAVGVAGRSMATELAYAALRDGFTDPPRSARPWTYWFWMDGHASREGITADLEAMDRAGLGGLILMEVDVGVPRGPVDFMGPTWRELFRHAVREAERLGLQITLNAGPGWTGSGGPWVKPEQSMQHLVASAHEVLGPTRVDIVLPVPERRPAFFGDGVLPPDLEKAKNEFYRDVAVLAFPTPAEAGRLDAIEEKALYTRAPYSSQPGVRPHFPAPAVFPETPPSAVVGSDQVVDLTSRMQPDGRWGWDAPKGRWTVLRFGRRSTGANTRPAPRPGLGLECDKLDAAALDAHFEAFIGTLLREVGERPGASGAERGWTMLHIDSWEMGAQNWTATFREEFRERRGYDPTRYLPALTGRIVDSVGVSERFLWDLRLTVQDLVVSRHATRLRELGRRHGFGLSIEPYDMTPCADLTLGTVADVPMGEFWLHGFKTGHTVWEAASVAHTCGRTIVGAEAFTSTDAERWLAYPGVMKTLGDWAFCAGVNRIVFHRYQHQPWLDRWPGMTMGPYGVHWERTQTWWDLVPAYHQYLARCQFLLRQGLPVVDVCFLAPEGAPHVFRLPPSAMRGDPPESLGYRGDGCAPETLIEHMTVEQGRLRLPGGMNYAVLVLPERETMTPGLLRRVRTLVEAGATVIGPAPQASPSLAGYPACDDEVRGLSASLWGRDGTSPPGGRIVGQGRVVTSRPAPVPGEASGTMPPEASDYGDFAHVTRILDELGLPPDFEGPRSLRYMHRRTGEVDLYFVAHRESGWLEAECGFRVVGMEPEVWDPRTASTRRVAAYRESEGRTWVPLEFEPEGSLFVVFRPRTTSRMGLREISWNGLTQIPLARKERSGRSRAAWSRSDSGDLCLETAQSGRHAVVEADGRERVVDVPDLPAPRPVSGPWLVRFQAGRGAPESVTWEDLEDWSTRGESGVRYFSGMATYSAGFDMPADWVRVGRRVVLDLGRVEVMARVRVNGTEAGVLWKAPYEVEITGLACAGRNRLEVEVANRWPNRLIGDQQEFEAGAERVTWTTWNPFGKDSPLLSSGLLGPVLLRPAVVTIVAVE